MANAFLPDVPVILNDQGLKIAPPPAGPKVTLLGITSNTGVPKLEPYTVGSVEKAMTTLYFQSGAADTTRFPGELSLAIEQAINAGANNLEVIVIEHVTGAQVLDWVDPTGAKSARLLALSGAYDVIRHRELDVVVPVGIYIDTTGTSESFGKQLADFCFQATSESNAAVGVIATAPVLEWAYMQKAALQRAWNYSATTGASSLSGEVASLFGGTAAASRQNFLFGTPSSELVNEWVRYHTLATSGTFKSEVWRPANYQAGYLAFLSGVFGSDSVKHSASAQSVTPSYLAEWQAKDSDGVLAVDSRGIKVDAGSYINVIACPLKAAGSQVTALQSAVGLAPTGASFNVDGAASYAGLINSLAPQSATTNKFMDGVSPLRLLSAKQANDLTGMRLVTLYQRSKGFVVSAGNTGAHNVNSYVRSDYVNLTTMRVTQAAVDLVRAVAEKYLGEPNTAARMNALDAEIRSVLGSMTSQGALNGSDFVISSTPDQRVLGILDISLTLVPAFEVRHINVTVSLSKEL